MSTDYEAGKAIVESEDERSYHLEHDYDHYGGDDEKEQNSNSNTISMPSISEDVIDERLTMHRRASYRSVDSTGSTGTPVGKHVSLDKRLSFIPNVVRRGSGQSSVEMSSDEEMKNKRGHDGIDENISTRASNGRRSQSQQRGSASLIRVKQRSSYRGAETSFQPRSSNTSSNMSNDSVGVYMGKSKAISFLRSKIRKFPIKSQSSSDNSMSTGDEFLNDQHSSIAHNSMWADAALVAQEDELLSSEPTAAIAARAYRRYKAGDDVLISNVSDWQSKVFNRFGYPAGKGERPEEQQGPYKFVLARVTKIHFMEIKPYYTVERIDTRVQLRSDSEDMEPIKGHALEVARAYLLKEENNARGRSSACCEDLTLMLENCFGESLQSILAMKESFREYVSACFDGEKKLKVSLSITHFFVACHLWYTFIPQLRLTFGTESSDEVIAVFSFIVWIVLVLELLLEFYRRPYDYFDLVRSPKSYAPSTRRFIGNFHFVLETFALILFLPEFLCIFTNENCSDDLRFGLLWSIRKLEYGESVYDFIRGSLAISFARIRSMGLLRHLCNRFLRQDIKAELGNEPAPLKDEYSQSPTRNLKKRSSISVDEVPKLQDVEVVHANRIGTGMLMVNSHYMIILILCISVLLPLCNIFSLTTVNSETATSTKLLYSFMNQTHGTDNIDCNLTIKSMLAWFNVVESINPKDISSGRDSSTYLMWADTYIPECENETIQIYDEQKLINFTDGYYCKNERKADEAAVFCFYKKYEKMSETGDCNSVTNEIGKNFQRKELKIRNGEILRLCESEEVSERNLLAKTQFNIQPDIKNAAFQDLGQQLLLTIVLFFVVVVLRRDTNRLVIIPVQFMLKIVSRYKNNPMKDKTRHRNDRNDENPGNFETEQLINAFTKITDLLRKCWGVAGANIITSNLKGIADKKIIINPLVPGKCVHALFGFAAIKNFEHSLRSLDEKIMILINIIANVLHGEVNRWGYSDSGQCNKNLGGLFLMVFHIGEDSAVQERLKEATSVVFNADGKMSKDRTSTSGGTSRGFSKSDLKAFNRGSSKVVRSELPLASLPGIDKFADRALIGMLKTYACIHRDRKIEKFVQDCRLLLGYGTEKFEPDMIFGMDAGWAVEGAVGSEYKIDATYLSPHVNMASRMMSACKMYGVTILLSQAVQSIVSKEAKSKLRHLDTVTVKGSINVQRIYTYDARYKGVDFFLSNPRNEAIGAESQSEDVLPWNNDLDLEHMRRHVTEAFLEKFNEGRDAYLKGHWEKAVSLLKEADILMVQNAVDSGYHDDALLDDLDLALQQKVPDNEMNGEVKLLKDELGDGACRVLISYMEKRNCIAPKDWKGWKALMSK